MAGSTSHDNTGSADLDNESEVNSDTLILHNAASTRKRTIHPTECTAIAKKGPATTASCVSPQQQDNMHLLLQLNKTSAPSKRIVLLPGHLPYPQLLANWQKHQGNKAQYGVRLVGDAAQPDDWVPISLDLFTSHSHWASA